jgi:protocatechuate 3,4-dioxygenase beta subunit
MLQRAKYGESKVETLEGRRLMAAGPEFQISAGGGDVDVATNAAGQTVVVWGYGQIRGRVYDAAGRPVGGEFAVSQAIPDHESRLADVAIDADGDFVVTWTTLTFDNLGRPSPGPTLVRRFSPSGTPKGNQQEVGIGADGPAVAMEDDGDYALVIDSTVQRYSANGVRQGASQALHAPFGAVEPVADMAADGTLVVAFTAPTKDDPADSFVTPAIRVQRFSPTGPALGPSVLVTNLPDAVEEHPDLSVNRRGEFAVTWSTHFWSDAWPPTKPFGIYARRYDAAGNPRGAAFRISGNANTFVGSIYPEVALDDAGNVLFAWQGSRQLSPSGGPADLFARRYNAAGAAVGGEFIVNSAGRRPGFIALDVDGQGDVIAVWETFNSSFQSQGIFGRWLFADTTPPPPPPPPPPQSGRISGAVFNDVDADGVRDAGEAGLSGRRVYIDADRDGVPDAGERTALTDASGNYSFANVAAGTYRVREVVLSGWRITSPSAGYHTVTLASGGSASGRNFGNTQKVLISGTVFSDANGDRVRQRTEPALPGRRVFLDADNDGRFDSGERSVLTDASGNYRFTNLSAGTYRVRVVPQTGWRLTAPTGGLHLLTLASGRTATGKLFGLRRSS